MRSATKPSRRHAGPGAGEVRGTSAPPCLRTLLRGMAGSRSGSAPETAAAADGWPKDALPKGSVPKDALPKGPLPKGSVPKDAIPEDALPKGSLPKDPLSEDALPEDALPEDPLSEDPVAEASPRGGRRVRVVASELRDVSVSVSCRV